MCILDGGSILCHSCGKRSISSICRCGASLDIPSPQASDGEAEKEDALPVSVSEEEDAVAARIVQEGDVPEQMVQQVRVILQQMASAQPSEGSHVISIPSTQAIPGLDSVVFVVENDK